MKKRNCTVDLQYREGKKIVRKISDNLNRRTEQNFKTGRWPKRQLLAGKRINI